MAASLEETLTSVWRQALVEEAKSVMLDNRSFPVRRTSRSRLREVDFQFEGHGLRGLEQNPDTGSRWAQLARQGRKSCNFSNSAVTLLWWWMEECTFMGKRRGTHLNSVIDNEGDEISRGVLLGPQSR
jgi:hypothetical protein